MTGSPAGEPTDDPRTISSTNRRGVSGVARRGKSVDYPSSRSPSLGRYWSIVAGLDGGLKASSSRNDGVIEEITGSYSEPGGDSRYDGKTSRIGLSATSRSEYIRGMGSWSMFCSTGRGGAGYEHGASGRPTTGSTSSVTITGRTDTWRSSFCDSKSRTSGSTGRTPEDRLPPGQKYS